MVIVGMIALTVPAQAQSIYYDDLWSFSGPTKFISHTGTTCRTAGVCARYCVNDHCAHGSGHLGSDGSWWYDGEFVEGYMTGTGVMTTDFYEYTGGFEMGRPHGHGVLVCLQGRGFEGNWIHGSLDGQFAGYDFPLC